jgi:hypothetical protein
LNTRIEAGTYTAVDPSIVEPVPAQETIAPGTLLAENATAVESLQIKLKAAELRLAKGKGEWDLGEFKAKVVGEAPLLVIVEFAGGLCGGFAAVPFEYKGGWIDRDDNYVADATGTSFVFSLRPTAARYPLQDKSKAHFLSGYGFQFGDTCLGIYDDGGMGRYENPHYAVPSGWETGDVKFTRFEVWRVTV